MNEKQSIAAKKAMVEWLSHPDELGKSPSKIEHAAPDCKPFSLFSIRLPPQSVNQKNFQLTICVFRLSTTSALVNLFSFGYNFFHMFSMDERSLL